MPACPILTYHSQLLFGNDYNNNSHIAPAEDLSRIALAGKEIVPLRRLVDALIRRDTTLDLDRMVCITFDDGCDFDWLENDHPVNSPQTSFASLLRAHNRTYPNRVPASATSFVIADPTARRLISQATFNGHNLIHDHWWLEAQHSGLLDIESHGLDHRHPSLDAENDATLGHFLGVDSETTCALQIDRANDLIAARVGNRRPTLFAYPYGQASDFLRYEYLPRRQEQHGLLAAVSTRPEHFSLNSDRWFLPRYAHVEHWTTGSELEKLIVSSVPS